MIILVVLVQTTLFAQSMHSIQKPLKLTSVAVGSITDDVLLIGTADQTAKKISVNSLLINKANLASPIFTGAPNLPTGTTATTQTAGNSTTAVATTAFVTTAANLKANLSSPTFAGTPNLPTGTIATTQTAGNNTTAIATTAFVTTAVNLKANLASPAFTGTPTVPTAVVNDYTTTIATTAFVGRAVPYLTGIYNQAVGSPINCTLGSVTSASIIYRGDFIITSFTVIVTVTAANTLTSFTALQPAIYTGASDEYTGSGVAYLSDTNIVHAMYKSRLGLQPLVTFYPTATGTYKVNITASYKAS